MNDREAFYKYPRDSWVYEKSNIAELYGVRFYSTIPDNRAYCVKPNVNLDGCSIDSKIVASLKGFTVPEGCLAFEYLDGIHWTADYKYLEDKGWVIDNVYRGIKSSDNFHRFTKWFVPHEFTTDELTMPDFLNYIMVAPVVNVEYIGNKAIEVHLRGNTDPIEYDEFYPDWGNYTIFDHYDFLDAGYVYIVDKEEHPGRLGFYCKKYRSE